MCWVFHSRYTARMPLAIASLSPSPSARLRSSRSRSGFTNHSVRASWPAPIVLGHLRLVELGRATGGDRRRTGAGRGAQLVVDGLGEARDVLVAGGQDGRAASQPVEYLVLLVGERPLQLAWHWPR